MPEAGPVSVSLGDAVTQFISAHPPKDGGASQLQRFVRWYGKDRPLGAISPWEIESFGQNSGADSLAKLQPVKAFLAYAHKEGMTQAKLATHLKVKRMPARQKGAKRTASPPPPSAKLSREGYQKANDDLESLRAQRVNVAQEIQRAMADKDFRENAPLDAARDQQAHLEARIRELEGTLRFAEIVEAGEESLAKNHRSRLGSKVVVFDAEFKESITYTLVDPNEVNLRLGKISVESPVGRAFLNRSAGEKVEVVAPAGVHHYKIERVES